MSSLALFAAAMLAGLTAWLVDELGRRRGLIPGGFGKPHRRAGGLSMLAVSLLLTIYGPLLLMTLSGVEPPTADSLTIGQLFAVHAVLAAALIGWFMCGYFADGELGRREQLTAFMVQMGMATSRLGRELRVGVMAGIGAWAIALLAATVAAVLLAMFGYEDLLPTDPAASILWVVGLPVGWRILASFSAGLIEEIFFRGFLQARLGIVGSTTLFVVAHAGYGQPFMFLGLTVLSLLYAGLVVWRQSVWAAVAAHTLFDLVQLVVVIPLVLGAQNAAAGVR